MTSERKYALGVIPLHPVPYQAPLYRALEKRPEIDSLVIYLDDVSIRGIYVPEFRTTIRHGGELLEGHRYVFTKNISSRPGGSFFWRVNPGLFPIIFRRRFDAILVTGYHHLSAYIAIAAAKMTGAKILLRAEADLGNHSRVIRTQVKRLLLPWVLRRADALMYSCQSNKDYFVHYGVAPERLFPVLSSIDIDALATTHAHFRHRRGETRQELGVPPEACIVLFVGRLTERKRVMDLLAATRDRLRAGDDFRLICVGDGPLHDDLAAAAADWGIADRVIFTGYRMPEDVFRIMAASDVFVIPSKYDPSPKVVNEAMLCGLPVVASTGLGLSGELVRDEETGLTFPTYDVPALAEQIRRLVADPALRTRLAGAGRQAVRAWSPEANAEGVLAALRYVCGDG